MCVCMCVCARICVCVGEMRDDFGNFDIYENKRDK